MQQQPYRLEEIPKEEGEALTKELQDVLKKYNAEMGVTSTIQLLKRVNIEPKAEATPEATGLVPSPAEFQNGGDEDKGKETESTTA